MSEIWRGDKGGNEVTGLTLLVTASLASRVRSVFRAAKEDRCVTCITAAALDWGEDGDG
jgi:hypothetical protein